MTNTVPSAARDSVIDMGVLKHVEVTPAEARAYFRWDAQARGDAEAEAAEADDAEAGEDSGEIADVPFERLAWLKTQEEFILTVTSSGLGKRASSYEYRITGRGGKGLRAHKLTGDARLVASFPVKDEEELLLVTDKGQLIRTEVDQIRIAGRATQGVILINVGEKTSMARARKRSAPISLASFFSMRGRSTLMATTPSRGTMAWCTCAMEAAAMASEMPANNSSVPPSSALMVSSATVRGKGGRRSLRRPSSWATVTPIMSGRVARNWPTFT